MRRTEIHPDLIKDYKILAIVITLCALSSCARSVATTEPPSGKGPDAIRTALSSAEDLFRQRSDIENLRKAVQTVAAIRDPDHRNFDVEWNFARYSYFLGKAEKDAETAEAIFEKGKDAGNIASRIEPNRPDGYFWFGANLGELARSSPVTVGIRSVNDIRESMEKVVELDPSYQGASAYDALGEVEMGTRSFKGGKAEKAVEYFEQGLKLAPTNSNLRLHLAKAYLALKQDVKARIALDALMSMQPDPNYVGEHQAAVTEARRLIERNFQ